MVESNKIVDKGETFLQALQKHCGGKLFLLFILFYATGNALFMIVNYGILGVFLLLFLTPIIIGLLLIYFESLLKWGSKITLSVLSFFSACIWILLFLYVINVPLSIHTFFTGGNFAALGAFYSLIYSGPIILFLIALLRIIRGVKRNIKENAPLDTWLDIKRSGLGALNGILLVSISGVIYAILEYLNVGIFTSFARSIYVYYKHFNYGIWYFGPPPNAGAQFGLISLAGIVVFIIVLIRLNRDLKYYYRAEDFNIKNKGE